MVGDQLGLLREQVSRESNLSLELNQAHMNQLVNLVY